jgi:hypothetical protein
MDSKANCKICSKFNTCKFVEKNREFSKQMYPMFEYSEWNNLDELFYKNAGSCKYFINDELNLEDYLDKISKAEYQLTWISNYLSNIEEPSDKISTLLEVVKAYEISLKL